MGKFIGLLLTIVCIWAGLEVYNNGVHGAFGGRLAFLGDESSATEPLTARSAPQRAGTAVEDAHAQANARREKLLGQ
ncbi:MAG: hypothetical protein QNK04_18180 [Myxococcota bacterium]|nr:hypothetical protein [Myxococcota bacterium]